MNDLEDIEFDEFEGLGDEEIREALLRRLQTTSAAKAIRTSEEVCDNRKAPAQARSQAASNLLRAGGFFARRESDGKDKELHEMTAEETRELLDRARRDLAARVSTLSKIKAPSENIFD